MPNTTYQKYKQTSLKHKLHTIIIIKYKAVNSNISSMLNGGEGFSSGIQGQENSLILRKGRIAS